MSKVNPMNNKQLSKTAADDSLQSGLVCLSKLLFTVCCPCATPIAYKVVSQYERAVKFRLGKLEGGPQGPGNFWILPCTDDFIRVDIREISFDIPPQQILTTDSVTVAVDAVVYYKITDPIKSVCEVQNHAASTKLLAQTTLRNTLGTRTLAQVLADRTAISNEMLAVLDAATDPWGVTVTRVEVKDVQLPRELQRAMSAEAEARREAQAKKIAAEGEVTASKSLQEAADVIAQSSSALQLRYLQTLANIAQERNSTILFPIPVDMDKK